mmetsp:Transcript_36329/g.75588  ORF Transcript_36329/g.75588 Transcript_36329/m.75588 type:complete len:489 (-) Transcript_36329:140-1606(-)|eukprot:CAMPEP_0172474056 /NCGR_PEP_ID=MMETSP1065-20121228/69162_1 /TAXON_ID=265537 /ORGANISM="Amphiprora paludosa, Strain CCMP125" /LENGTH=488 /DNA_ID=CAMNT_0013232233 /DNA_START=98 /DNA_END=1564 /DNA_ORIENTATION=+
MSSSINGGGGRGRQALSSVDFYRRVPKDLTEATALGAAMSICAMLVMGILFLSETAAFASTKIATSITLDENEEPQIRLNFNITLLDLHCDYVSVDVWDALGTNRQNVTKNVDKWQLDEAGARRIFSGRNREQRELRHEEHDLSLEEMHENEGVHAMELTKENFAGFLEENEMAFIDMFAPWCVWCQRLAPTWEKFAQEIKKEGMPVGVGKMDCVAQADLCRQQKIMAFPTLRWYHAGEAVQPDYKMDRTVQALTAYAKRKLEMDEKYKEWFSKNEHQTTDEEKDKKRQLYQQNRPEHPGCQVSGHLMVNRVPGNFHIEAKSKSHNLNAAMTNLSHVVNHLSFGPPIDMDKDRKARRILKQVPEEHRQFSPMDDSDYVTKQFHQAYHHYIKVVSTHLNMGSAGSAATDTNTLLTYQFLEQSQIVYYSEVNVPEARFSYDLSPMSVVVEKEGRKWYDYLTSLCAIIGGTFTTLGLIDATLYKVFKPKKL